MHVDHIPTTPIVTIRSVTLYPPGHPPIEIPGARVLGSRSEQGVPLVATRDELGRQVNWVGFPFAMVMEESPSGLVGARG